MTISDTVRKALYKRAGGRCECQMASCDHHRGTRCPDRLGAGFEAQHLNADGLDAPSNLVAMCTTCYTNTRNLAVPR